MITSVTMHFDLEAAKKALGGDTRDLDYGYSLEEKLAVFGADLFWRKFKDRGALCPGGVHGGELMYRDEVVGYWIVHTGGEHE